MTNKTVLSDEQIGKALHDAGILDLDCVALRYDLDVARAAEQAVLQSPEIQGVMNASKAVSKVFWATHLEYEKLHVAIKMMDAAVAAMEQKP